MDSNMKRGPFLILLCLVVWLAGAIAQAQTPIELRFLCFSERNECDVYSDLLARFSQEHPGIHIAVDLADEAEILDRLGADAESGAAYDFARISDFAALRGQYLDMRPPLSEPEALEATFRAVYIAGMRADGEDDGLYGFPDALGVVAPFVNLSLFERADVAVPAEGASWYEWLAALEQVVAATDAAYVLSVDNKDHRLVGPAMSLGAEYFDVDGALTLPDVDGLRAFLLTLNQLKEQGKAPADTLLGTGKSQEYFVRGETVMYICGSWKVEEVAAQVGDAFEWAIVPNPTGAGGGTGVAQATAVMALAGTAHPDAVARVFDYLIQSEVSAEFAARSLTIPARADVAASGIDYRTDDEVVAVALNAFGREVPKLQDQAIALDLHPLAPVYYDASNELLRAYFAGALTLDEALAALRARLAGA